MALPWPHGTPTLTIPTVRPTPRVSQERTARPELARWRDLALSPTTALVAMVLGLVLLFAAPLIGLPFVALIVLPAVVFHLRAENRPHLRGRR